MELGEGFKLCSGLCIGARAGREKNELLLSFDVGTVQIYDVSDTISFRSNHTCSLTSSHFSTSVQAVSHSCIRSWQLPSDQCLCSPAIYHSSSDRYWVVHSNRGTHTSNTTVCIWYSNTHTCTSTVLLYDHDSEVWSLRIDRLGYV